MESDLNQFGLDFGLIGMIGGTVFLLTEAAKAKLSLVGVGTQIFAALAAAFLAWVKLQPSTPVEWGVATMTAFVAWLAPDGLHKFFAKKNGGG